METSNLKSFLYIPGLLSGTILDGPDGVLMHDKHRNFGHVQVCHSATHQPSSPRLKKSPKVETSAAAARRLHSKSAVSNQGICALLHLL